MATACRKCLDDIDSQRQYDKMNSETEYARDACQARVLVHTSGKLNSFFDAIAMIIFFLTLRSHGEDQKYNNNTLIF